MMINLERVFSWMRRHRDFNCVVPFQFFSADEQSEQEFLSPLKAKPNQTNPTSMMTNVNLYVCGKLRRSMILLNWFEARGFVFHFKNNSIER